MLVVPVTLTTAASQQVTMVLIRLVAVGTKVQALAVVAVAQVLVVALVASVRQTMVMFQALPM